VAERDGRAVLCIVSGISYGGYTSQNIYLSGEMRYITVYDPLDERVLGYLEIPQLPVRIGYINDYIFAPAPDATYHFEGGQAAWHFHYGEETDLSDIEFYEIKF